MKKVIATAAAPAALGPYNQAIAYGDLLFVSGQTARYPAGVTATRPESAAEQMRVALNNVMEILHAGGSDAAHILKTTVFLTDMADFESVNAVYCGLGISNYAWRTIFESARTVIFEINEHYPRLQGVDGSHRVHLSEADYVVEGVHELLPMRSYRAPSETDVAIAKLVVEQIPDGAGTRQLSGIGGQMDFLEGAYRSRGRKGFICINASRVTKDGERKSNIVAAIPSGSTVSAPRTMIQHVATECGIAVLSGKSLRERAEAMAAIAHPDFREKLMKYARENFR